METLRVFVSGTDTGVGKTTFCKVIFSLARARAWRVAALKPIETGCAAAPDGSRIPADGTALRDGASVALPLEVVCPIRFSLPRAPLVAARAERRRVELGAIDDVVAQATAARPDVLLIEGAGGLLVPVTEKVAMADLARSLDCQLVIVARASLGTINHTLLTVEAAVARGLTVAAVILNEGPEPCDPDLAASNAALLREMHVAPFVAVVPRLDVLTTAGLALSLESVLGPWLDRMVARETVAL